MGCDPGVDRLVETGRGTNGEETREGSSTPGPETSAVWPLWQYKTEEKEGGGEGTRATTDRGTGKSDYSITEDERGQAGQKGVPRNGTATSEVAKDKEAEGTNTEVGEAAYLVERVHGADEVTGAGIRHETTGEWARDGKPE
jgi:hypothetical protein